LKPHPLFDACRLGHRKAASATGGQVLSDSCVTDCDFAAVLITLVFIGDVAEDIIRNSIRQRDDESL
jgi:hypothetical protein